ncbi:MAG: hypothetical protein HZB55_08555 [Deltaproteobacteria bacterium]|nr:hypothetical protein [Deltaproteobacteria bacterium]
MTNRRMQDWEAGDFSQHFRKLAAASKEKQFQERFAALAGALEPLDREFFRETARCGRDLTAVVENLQRIAGREGYCDRPRGFDTDCEVLYRDVDHVIARVGSLREGCFV